MIRLLLNLWKLRVESQPRPEFVAALRKEIFVASGQSVIFYRATTVMHYTLAPLAIALLLGAGTTSYAYASPSVSSGHLLFPLKSGAEEVEKVFYQTPEGQAVFCVKMLERRADEVNYVMDHGGVRTVLVMQRVADESESAEQELEELAKFQALQQEHIEEMKAMQQAMRDRTAAVLRKFRAKVVAADMDEAERDHLLLMVDARLAKLANH